MLNKKDKQLMEHLVDIKQTDIEIDEYITRSNFERSIFGILNSQLQNGSPLPLENVKNLFRGSNKKPKPGISPVKNMINGCNDELLHTQYLKNFGFYKQTKQGKKPIKQRKVN